jgi:GxxExxY protein
MLPYTQEVREICQYISQQLGVGHSEKVYQEALAVELRLRGYIVELERVVPIMYFAANSNISVCIGYARLDLLVTKPNFPPFIIELKAAASLSAASLRAQVQVYLKALRSQYPDITGIGIQFMQPGTKDVPVSERVQILEDDIPNLIESGPVVTLNI